MFHVASDRRQIMYQMFTDQRESCLIPASCLLLALLHRLGLTYGELHIRAADAAGCRKIIGGGWLSQAEGMFPVGQFLPTLTSYTACVLPDSCFLGGGGEGLREPSDAKAEVLAVGCCLR